jgi:fluoroquinolone transport system ATP-binding protein
MNQIFEIKDLVYSYPKAKEPTIKTISFTVKKGTIFGLLGPSGAGKSTTQKILTKLLSNYQGTITYCDKNLINYKKDYYEEIGVGFEIPVHFGKLTGRENLEYFSSFYQKRVDYVALMERVGLADALDQEVSQYSKGMKVRLNFVRALLNDPKVLFLDEPTNGLDPKNAKIVKDMIKEFRERGGTVIITTHLMGDVEELCDEVVFMNKGAITEAASPRTLKLQYGKKEVRVEYLENNELIKKIFKLENLSQSDEFNACLAKDIQTIHSGETTLDDIFIKITGDASDDATTTPR